MRRRASAVNDISVFPTKILVTEVEILSYEHSSPVTVMKLERSRLVRLSKPAEISLWTEGKIRPDNRLPGSYEEALSQYVSETE